VRRDYNYVNTTCARGINEQTDLAGPNQCAEALNVWAPGGRVEKRPGYEGVSAFAYNWGGASVAGATVIKESPIGTFSTTTNLSSLPVGDRWYAGFTSYDASAVGKELGVQLDVAATNSNACYAKLEYWNGTTWVGLRTRETVNIPATGVTHLGDASSAFWFPFPGDLAQTTINGVTAYFFRGTVQANAAGVTALDGSVTLSSVAAVMYSNVSVSPIAFFGAAQFPYSKRYIAVETNNSNSLTVFYNVSEPANYLLSAEEQYVAPLATTFEFDKEEPASAAVVPQFEEMYVAYDRQTLVFRAAPALQTSAEHFRAAVEDDPAIVGSGAPYDPAEIAQLGSWPRAKYISFFRGELWAANLDDSGDYSIRWSAPQPYYKVWPELNIEVLMEDDNSPITGFKGFDQHMVVFKNDSIWRMVDAGISDFGLQTYAPERVVAGVGCVSNSSIQQIQGMLVFLAEDGIYGFNGATAEKLTLDLTPKIGTGADRLKDTIARITPGRRPFATAAHWKKHSMYLLAVSLDGSDTNSHVIAWDYKNDTWWLWDNLPVRYWLSDEDAADNERLYFMDSIGRIYEFGVGKTDHGAAISAYVVTQRLARSDTKKRARSIALTSTNRTRGATIELISNDEAEGTSGSIVLTDSLEKEYGTSSSSTTATYSTDSYTPTRRRSRRIMFNDAADWFQVKVSHATKNVPFAMNDITLGYVALGRR
jgi:hypothetical protein